MQVTFKNPTPIDLVELAGATAAALEVLEPWWAIDLNDPSLAIFIPISEQAHSYVRAIDSSILAAQQGFNIAGDAIHLSKLMENNAPKVEQDEFAKSMAAIAGSASERARTSLNEFRDVRSKVLSLIEITEKSLQEHELDTMKDQLIELGRGVETLEMLSENLDAYVTWWGWISMTTHAQIESAEQLKVKYTSLRKQAVVMKWQGLREGFVQYTVKIAELQDIYPTMFIHSRSDGQAVPRPSICAVVESFAPTSSTSFRGLCRSLASFVRRLMLFRSK